MNMRRVRIGYLSWHPAPYRDDFLKRIIKSARLDVVVYTAKTTGDEHTFCAPDYPTEILMPRKKSDFGVLVRMLRKLVFGGFDYTFWPGFMSWPVITCEVVSALLGKRYVFCTDCVGEHKTSAIKKWLRSYIIRHSYALIVGGDAGRHFFGTEYGIPNEKMLDGVYSLEGEFLESRIAALRFDREKIRRMYSISPEQKVFLMVANMTPNRNYPVTVGGFREFVASHIGSKFVICGTGAGLSEMQRIAKSDRSVVVIPGVAFDEMLKLYAMADVYVHGGTEPASTALQIGAIANLPLMSSKAVGLAWDLVKDGETGVEIKDFNSVGEWSSAFKRMAGCSDEWVTMGREARELSRKLDAAQVAEKFVEYFASHENSGLTVLSKEPK